MHKSLVGLTAAAALGLAAVAAPAPANADCVAYYPAPAPAYYPAPGPGYAELAPGCYWAKRQVWVEGFGYRWRTVQICR